MEFDDTILKLNQYGPYQRRLTLFVCMGQVITALHTLSPAYTAYRPPHWCRPPVGVKEHYSNCTAEQLRDMFTPPLQTSRGVTYDRCYTYNLTSPELAGGGERDGGGGRCDDPLGGAGITNTTPVVECDHWYYDDTHLRSTVVTDFDLVCDRSALSLSAAGGFLLAQCVGFIIFGPITDKIGRWKVMLIGNCMAFMTGLALVFSVNYTMFLVLRIALGLSVAAEGCSASIMLMEHVGPRYRVLVGVLLGASWGVATHSLTIMAYFTKDWRMIQLIIALPNILVIIIVIFLVRESPRWLLVQGRKAEANKILSIMARVNHTHFDVTSTVTVQIAKHESYLSMIRRPRFTLVSLVLYVSWFASGLCYYGITFNAPSVGTSPFISYTISTLMDFPSKLVVYLCFNYIGRVVPLSVGNITGGVLLLSTIFVVDNFWVHIVLLMTCKGFISGSYTSVYIYTSEMYPTSVRSSSLGISLTFTRIASTLGAYVFMLSSVYRHLPVLICGFLVLCAGVFDLSLPETRMTKMTQTLTEGDRFLKKRLFGVCRRQPAEDTTASMSLQTTKS